MLPLLAAGLLLGSVPSSDAALRAASAAGLVVTALVWASPAADLMAFVTPVLSRLPVESPAAIHAMLLAAVAVMLVPPLLATAVVGVRLPVSPTTGHLGVLLLLGGSLAGAYVAPAYTAERPERRTARFLQDAGSGRAFWEVGGLEAALDLAPGADRFDWRVASGPPPLLAPLPALNRPFVHRAAGPAAGMPSGTVAATLARAPDGLRLRVVTQPFDGAIAVQLRLPAGVTPTSASLPDLRTDDGWAATDVAPGLDALEMTAGFARDRADAGRRGAVVLLTTVLPGGVGPWRLPRWLPAERTVWSTEAVYSFPLSTLLEAPAPDPPAAGAGGERSIRGVPDAP